MDLNYIQADDFVYFRCGGTRVRVSSISKDVEQKKFMICLVDKIDGVNVNYCQSYHRNGCANTKSSDVCLTPFDIVRFDVAPFNWSTVKAGMAFKNNIYSPIYYIGMDTNGVLYFDLTRSDRKCSVGVDSFGGKGAHLGAGLERAPMLDRVILAPNS